MDWNEMAKKKTSDFLINNKLLASCVHCSLGGKKIEDKYQINWWILNTTSIV